MRGTFFSWSKEFCRAYLNLCIERGSLFGPPARFGNWLLPLGENKKNTVYQTPDNIASISRAEIRVTSTIHSYIGNGGGHLETRKDLKFQMFGNLVVFDFFLFCFENTVQKFNTMSSFNLTCDFTGLLGYHLTILRWKKKLKRRIFWENQFYLCLCCQNFNHQRRGERPQSH